MANKLTAFSIVVLLMSCGGVTAKDDGGIDAIVGSDAGFARDAGIIDAGAGGGASSADAGAQNDAGSPDAGAVVVDAGAVDVDAGAVGVDAGAVGVDAGAVGVDAGAGNVDAGVCTLPFESDVQTVLSVGHIDVLDVGLGCGGLHLALADGTDRLQSSFETLRAPESVLLHGSSALLMSVPSHVDNPELAFLGPEGSNIYLFQETQVDGALWPGVKSQRVPSGAVAGDALVLVLESASGPGPFFAFDNPSSEMPLRLLFDADGGHTEAALPVQTQSQPNWAFPSAGLHRLVFSTKAQLADGGVLSSPPRNYRFFLGELSDLPASEPTVIAVTGLSGSYAPGETMVLNVQRFGAPSMLPVQWERQCYSRGDAGELLEDAGFFLRDEWTVLPAPSGVLTTLPDSSCQYRASLMDGSRRVATTQPVLPNVN